MKWIKKKIKEWKFKKGLKWYGAPQDVRVYEVPKEVIIGEIIGLEFVKEGFNEIMTALGNAIVSFWDHGTINEAGKDQPALTLVIHPDMEKTLFFLTNTMSIPLLQVARRQFNIVQVIEDERMPCNALCVENFVMWTHLNDYKFVDLTPPPQGFIKVGAIPLGLKRYCIYLKDPEELKKEEEELERLFSMR